eukprot:TRINITY_DN6548_c0_g1_i1.p1 TRINITY_DN6548_c0_g1~~TRINITY_DN6548_c0_g1_i1.p1  ORF type:complete len:186 (-),score=22.77 TRINITY_DN6548_c0_g1_i1:69-626(-)
MATQSASVSQVQGPVGVISTGRQLNEACLHFMMIEMVDYIMRSTENTTSDASANTEAVYYKLERLGFRVGQQLVERFTMDHTRFQDTLEVIKFLCKEFWLAIFKKQVDNLRTNHKGVYVLNDNKFRWLVHLSYDHMSTQKEAALPFVMFPCGLIRGALSNLGVSAQVTAEVASSPACTFTKKKKP